MKSFRTAFLITLFTSIVLAAGLAWIWWRSGSRSHRLERERTASTHGTEPAGATGGVLTAASAPVESRLAPVKISPQRLQSIGVKTGVVEMKPAFDEVRTVGNVEVDERRLAYVQVRFPGWIKNVFADSTYQYVRKGQPLFTIYSPDLVTTEQEYLMAKRNSNLLAESSVPGVAAGAKSLLNAATERLRQWEVPAREIDRLERTGEVRQELEIDSPVSGYVMERNALPNMYVQPETRLYSVAGLSTVWVYAEVFQSDVGRLKTGNPATVTVDAYPGLNFGGRVSYILPQVDKATRTVRVRLVFPNSGLKLKPGMFVNVSMKVPLGRQVVIPALAVFHSGTRAIAFVDRGEGNLEPREIELGPRAGEDFVVLKGLRPGERIITSANFLIDSESQLQAALGSFAPPPPGAGAGAAMNAPSAQASVEFTTVPSPPHKGDNTFRVKLTESNGSPIAGAQVTVTLFMPAMPAMGMAAMRTVVALSDRGGGKYEGSGELQSGGSWQVTIAVQKEGQILATRQLTVSAEGGM